MRLITSSARRATTSLVYSLSSAIRPPHPHLSVRASRRIVMTPADVNRDAAFEIPLSPTQLQQLGLLSAIWSQIDHLTTSVVAGIMQVEPMKAEVLMERTM